MAKVKKFKWEIDETEEDHGVKVISLVDEPAFESEFIAFSKEKIKHKFIKLEEQEYKQVVAGLAMIPDQEIPRIDPETNEPYVGYFDAETIEKIRNKFHKEQQDQNVNTDHEDDVNVEAFMISDYIISSDLQVEDLINKGIEEAVIGAWYVEYKIEDTEVFEKVLEGEYNGFSVELYADRILESFKYNNNYKNKFSMKNLLEKFKDLINEFEKEDEEVTLERAPVPSLEIIIEWNEVGEIVNSVITDENGDETLEPIEDGDYELEDGKVLVVTDGVLAEIKDAPAEEVPAEKDEELEADSKAEKVTEKVNAEDEEVKAEEEDSDKDSKKTLEELIDLSQDGYYTVEVSVEGGAIVYGAVYANTYKDLKFNSENFEKVIADSEILKAEKAELDKKIVELEKKIKAPIADPKGLTDGEETEVEVDLSKLSNYERIALKNNLPIV